MDGRALPRLLCAMALAAGAAAAEGDEAGLASWAGERLEYRARWGVVPVARVVLEVQSAADGAVLLRATGRTRSWIDPVYPVRDVVESTIEAATLRPLRFWKRTKEGHGRAHEVEVTFDRVAGVAHYVRDGAARQPFPLPPEFQDPLSCLYAYRALAPGREGRVSVEVADGKRLIAGEFREVGRERQRTPAGEFDTVVVEPEIEGIGGVFRQSRKSKLRIWFTDDARRVPVRFYTEVAVGSFTLELTARPSAADEGRGRPPTPPPGWSRRRR